MSLFSSLTNRIFVATAALAVLGIAIAVYQINVGVTAQAENELGRGLEEAGMLVEEHRTTLFDHFAREARLAIRPRCSRSPRDTSAVWPPTCSS